MWIYGNEPRIECKNNSDSLQCPWRIPKKKSGSQAPASEMAVNINRKSSEMAVNTSETVIRSIQYSSTAVDPKATAVDCTMCPCPCLSSGTIKFKYDIPNEIE